MTEIPREKREDVIKKRLQMKLNRDALLKLLDENKKDEKEGEDQKKRVLKDFYDRYDKEISGDEKFNDATQKNNKIRQTKIKINKLGIEIGEYPKMHEKEMEEIEEKKTSIAEKVFEIEYGPLLERFKLLKMNHEWDELTEREKEIQDRMDKLQIEKQNLERELEEKKKEYGWKEKSEEGKSGEKMKSEMSIKNNEKKEGETLKLYKENYEALVKAKQEYKEKLIEELEKIDFGISEALKAELVEKIKTEMEKKFIEEMKNLDSILEEVEKIETRFKQGRKEMMEKIGKLREEIEKKDEELRKIQLEKIRKRGEGLDNIKILEREILVNKEKIGLEREYNSIKEEINNKLKLYDGTVIDWTKPIVIETRDKRLEREKLEKERQERERLEKEKYEREKCQRELEAFREKWEKVIDLDEKKKNKIIQVVNGLKPIVYKEDGNKVVEFELGGKKYKVMDVDLQKYSDYEYYKVFKTVNIRGMMGDNPDEWYNKHLAEHVKKETIKGYKIPTIEFQKELLNELGEKAGLSDMRDKIAMRMYLTGNYGNYRLTMGDNRSSNSQANSRSDLRCFDYDRNFNYDGNVNDSASLCLIACE